MSEASLAAPSFIQGQGTQYPSHSPLPTDANCISQSHWGLRPREWGDWAHSGGFKEGAVHSAGRKGWGTLSHLNGMSQV